MAETEIIDDILEDMEKRMRKSLESFRYELARVRTGRATTALVEDIRADYYGVSTPLKQMSTISVPEPKTIVIQPWDTSAIPAIEKAILQSDLGLNPSNDGKIIRLVLPVLTQERRKGLVRHVGKIAEQYRISIRNIRRDANSMLREVEKEEHIPQDEAKRTQNKIQRITDEYIEKVNECLSEKEKEIMEI